MKDTAIQKTSLTIKMLIGKISAHIKKIGSRWLNVASPTSTLGVRGTDFEFGVADDGSTLVAVSEGEVLFYADDEIGLKGGNVVEYDIEKGINVKKMEEKVSWEDWRNERMKRFKERQREMISKLNQIMNQRVDRYKKAIDDAEIVAEKGEEGEMNSIISTISLIEDGVESSSIYFRKHGVKPDFQKRLDEVRKQWEKRRFEVAKRFEKRREEIKKMFEKKREEIEKRREEQRKKLKKEEE